MAKALNQNLHSQFRSVVDTLASTAVKEISKLVDDGFAILHLEISRSQEENEALKCKLQMMEVQMARCYAEDSGLRERLAMCRCSGVQSDENLLKPANVFAERYRMLKIDSELQPGPENSPTPDLRAEVSYPDISSGAGRSVAAASVPCTDMEEGSTELVLIKEEGVEEDNHPQGEMNSREKRSGEWRAASREKRPVQETQYKAANHTEELTEQHRTRRAVWEVSGLDSALKTEPETERAESPQHTGYEQSAGRLHSSCPESLMCERTSRLRTLCTQGADETEAGAPSCSYATESSCESLSIHSGLQSLPSTGNTAACSLSLGSVAVKPEAVMMDSAAAEEEAEVLSTWSAEPISENIPAQRKHYSQERPFVCQQCGKRFIHLSHFTIHRRVHTGEKPYRCTVCQQQFSRSGSLNRHYRVHTGERPFRCTYCGKCFSESGNLRKHQQTHNRERPFRCTYCGRMFISAQVLQKHQQRVHRALVL